MSLGASKLPAKKNPVPAKKAAVRRPAPRIVLTYARGEAGKALLPTSTELIRLINAGLPVRELNDLQVSLGITWEKLAPLLLISKATLHRIRAGRLLTPAVSDRVVRYARLLGWATEVLESEENARLWLAMPAFGLGGTTPLEFAKTEIGAREVEQLLGRIEYGVFS